MVRCRSRNVDVFTSAYRTNERGLKVRYDRSHDVDRRVLVKIHDVLGWKFIKARVLRVMACVGVLGVGQCSECCDATWVTGYPALIVLTQIPERSRRAILSHVL